MNRSTIKLLSACAFAPVVAAFAVAAVPANAAKGPATTLLYDTATGAAPVTGTLPAPVVNRAGRAAETGTGAVDGILRAAPVAAPLPHGRSAETPLSMPVPGLTSGLPDVPSMLGLGGLPAGSKLLRETGRHAGHPSGDAPGSAVNKAGKAVGKAGGLVGSKGGAGKVVDVLTAKERSVSRVADGPLSMPGASVLGLADPVGLG
ncbi:hypothetical protein [Actinomadura madurae]|uniref:hypothetical protein n=1 Tax=Actinomadura madurae TaxID=1993 RepID=UPI000D925C4A|nr:hypothetical protein [Actinomadura madurae]SPT60416.1 Uncharacterised protein [Actinomadura madurae]